MSTDVFESLRQNQLNNPSFCPTCGGESYTVRERSPSPHYAHRRCRDCQVFLGWVPKPSTLQRQQDQRETIEKLLGNCRLSDWERSFCEGLKACKKLSPKQLEILNRILTERGGVL